MVAEASLSSIGYFMPILSFLLVFIIIYALLFKTKVLGENQPIMLLISLILSGFFIVEANMVEFVQLSSAWFVAVMVCVFFLVALTAFIPGIKIGEFLGGEKGGWFAWVVLGLVVAVFIISSAYVFNWVVNWGMIRDWFTTDWFGMVLLLVIALVVSLVIKGKAS